MKKLASVLTGALVLSSCNVFASTDPCPASYQSNPQEAEQALSSVASVTVVFQEPSSPYFGLNEGQGIILDGYVLTAAHVVAKAHRLGPDNVAILVKTFGSFSNRMSSPARLVYYNEVDDVALLQTRIPSISKLEVVSAKDLVVGTPVCVFSIDQGFEKGEISRPESEIAAYSPNWFAFETDGFVAHGSSGGAVYARLDGELTIVGIVHRFVEGSPHSVALGTDIVGAAKLMNFEIKEVN